MKCFNCGTDKDVWMPRGYPMCYKCTKMEKEKFDEIVDIAEKCTNAGKITCPHCGQVIHDFTIVATMDFINGKEKINCDKCKKDFLCTIETRYTSEKIFKE